MTAFTQGGLGKRRQLNGPSELIRDFQPVPSPSCVGEDSGSGMSWLPTSSAGLQVACPKCEVLGVKGGPWSAHHRVILSSSFRGMHDLLEAINNHASASGRRANASKIKVMAALIPGEQRQAVLLDGES